MKKIPFVLLNLLAPMFLAADGGAGGGDPEPTPAADPKPGEEPPPPAEPPKPEGETIEARLNSALGHIKNLFDRAQQLMSQLASANSAKGKIEAQFNAVSADFQKEKEEHGKLKAELDKANTTVTGLTQQRDDANKNVERLEKLCNLRGIDPSQAVPVPPSDAKDYDSKRQELVAKLNKEQDPMKRGQLANELREFDRKRAEKPTAK